MKHHSPLNPIAQEQELIQKRIENSSRTGTTVRFITKEFFQFLVVVILMFILNTTLIFSIVFIGVSLTSEEPSIFVESNKIENSLVQTNGTYEIKPDQEQRLKDEGIWFILLNKNSQILYQFNTPHNLPIPENSAQVYEAAHYGKLGSFVCYGISWEERDHQAEPKLLIMGYHNDPSYRIETLRFKKSDIDLALTCIFVLVLLNILLAFIIYLVRRRSLIHKTTPLVQGINDLAQGKSPQLPLMGDFTQLSYQINQASELLSNRDQARLDWIRGVSHDIRTPLTSIIVYSENLLERRDVQSSERKQLEAISSQAIRIRDLLDDFGVLQIIDYDLSGIQFEKIHPAKLLRGIATSCVNELDENLYEMSLSLDPRIQAIETLGNERLLNRAVINLIANAVKHNPKGCEIDITAGIEEGSKSWFVQVTDTGHGMSAHDLAALTEKLCSSTCDKKEGPNTAQHGLGLELVQKIAHIHNGSLELTSVEDQGFTAKLTLSLDPNQK